MPLSEVEGQPRAVSQLRAGAGGGRTHHAYLFTGPAGVGKAFAALRFAQALSCEVDPDGCGRCESCRHLERGSHPDCLRVEADLAGGSREIRIQQIRELCASLQFRPVQARQKVALILGAERMRPPAQNALLKTLEEPPPQTVLVLVCDGDDRLLATVRSRCLRVAFGPLPRELLARSLAAEGVPEAEAALRAALSQGSGERARGLDGAALARRTTLWAWLQRVVLGRGSDAALLEALEFAEEAGSDRDRASEALRAIAWLLRDLLVLGGGRGATVPVGELVNIDLDRELRELAGGLPAAWLVRCIEATRRALSALEGNGAPRLQLEAAFLRLAGAAP